MASPRLSIVIATFNAAATLERCLRSIIAQSFVDWEIIIADGASTDETTGIIRRYSAHVAHWHSHPDAGIYDAWNQALQHARGEFVCFLGADDAWIDSEALAALFDAIGNGQPDLVSAKGLVVDALGEPLGVIGRAWSYRGIRRRMLICHPGSLHRRSSFDTLGPFDTRYRIAADYEWMLRLPRTTRAIFLDRVVILVQEGGVSRRQRRKTLSEYWRIQSQSPRVGIIRASTTYVDRLLRAQVARLLRIHY